MKKKKHIDNEKIIDSITFGLDNEVASSTDTTGLIPAKPQNEYELDSYKAIDDYQQKPIC